MGRKQLLVLGKEHQIKRAYQAFPLAFLRDKDVVQRDRVPEDLEEFDSIILTDVPPNITELRHNHTIPTFAIPTLKPALEQEHATDIAILLPEDPTLLEKTITTTEQERTTALAEWDILRKTFKLFYPDIADTVERISAEHHVPRFSAFYQAMKPEMLNLSPSLPFERAQIELVERVTSYEKALHMQGQAHAGYFRAQAEEALREFLTQIETHRDELKRKLSIGETAGKGSRILYAAVAADAKYRFLKEIRTKNGIHHAIIADISANDATHFKNQDIKIPDSSPPLSGNDATYLIREAIVGPTIDDLFNGIRNHNEKLPDRDRKHHAWLSQVREVCVYTLLRDIVKWQRDAPALPASIDRTPAGIAEHLTRNLDDAFRTYSTYMPVTDSERRLWAHATALFNPTSLQLTPDRIYRHFDASLSNFKLNAGRSIRTAKELKEFLQPRKPKLDDAARKKLVASIYSVDQGFTHVHEDEDFFHVVTSFGLFDAGLLPQAKLDKINEYYTRFNAFRKRGRKRPNNIAFNLHGYYRGFVSGYRIITNQHGPLTAGSRERVQHRLQLAQAFAEDELARTYQHFLPGKTEDICAAIEHSPSESRQDELRLEGLRYFAEKFSKIPSRATPQTGP